MNERAKFGSATRLNGGKWVEVVIRLSGPKGSLCPRGLHSTLAFATPVAFDFKLEQPRARVTSPVT